MATRWAALQATDTDIGVRKDRIALLRRVGMLRMLPVPAIEGLAQRLRRMPVPAGTVVFREGDQGEDFYVIESGSVAVLRDEHEVRRLAPGDAFGEIALLRAVPRTATVRAVKDTELAALSGPDFVAAVTGFSATSSTAERLVSGYLAEDVQRRASGPVDRDKDPGRRQ